MITFVLPIKIISEGNSRLSTRTIRAKRKRQKAEVVLLCPKEMTRLNGSLRVTLTKLFRPTHPQRMDSDNLASSFKATRDAIAACIGIDDGKIIWTYAQEPNTKDEHAVRVEIDEDAP